MLNSKLIATILLILLVAGCNSTTINNSGGTSDTSPAKTDLLITRYGQPNIEVFDRTIPAPTLPAGASFGDPMPNKKMDFSILATATDPESGIRTIKLFMTRTVCFRTSAGNISQAYFGTVERKSATYPANQAPTQASLGDTGIFDNSPFGTDPANLQEINLLVRRSGSGQLLFDAVGVSTKWNMEATNFASQTTYSDVIFIRAGDTSCVTQP